MDTNRTQHADDAQQQARDLRIAVDTLADQRNRAVEERDAWRALAVWLAVVLRARG